MREMKLVQQLHVRVTLVSGALSERRKDACVELSVLVTDLSLNKFHPRPFDPFPVGLSECFEGFCLRFSPDPRSYSLTVVSFSQYATTVSSSKMGRTYLILVHYDENSSHSESVSSRYRARNF